MIVNTIYKLYFICLEWRRDSYLLRRDFSLTWYLYEGVDIKISNCVNWNPLLFRQLSNLSA